MDLPPEPNPQEHAAPSTPMGSMMPKPRPYEPDFSILLELSMLLINSQAGQILPPDRAHLVYADVLARKLLGHWSVVQTIDGGATAPTAAQLPDSVDHASIKVQARAGLETYLAFSFIFGPADSETSLLRFKAWKLGGLRDRRKIHATQAKNLQVQQDDAVEIETLRQELRLSPAFTALTDQQAAKLLGGDWRYGLSWVDVGVAAGHHRSYVGNMYRYLCGYAHSSYVSAEQIRTSAGLEQQQRVVLAVKGFGNFVLAHLIGSYPRLFPTAAAVLQQEPAAANIARYWELSAKNLSKFYGDAPDGSPRPESTPPRDTPPATPP